MSTPEAPPPPPFNGSSPQPAHSPPETPDTKRRAPAAVAPPAVPAAPGRTKTRVLHVISGLGAGGAERMLCNVVRTTRHHSLDQAVVSLTSDTPLASTLTDLGASVSALSFRRGIPDPRAIAAVARAIRCFRPHVVHSWMYHADLVAGIAARLCGRVPVIWGVRHGRPNTATDKLLTLVTIRLCAFASRSLPARILFNAEEVLKTHAALGYATRNAVVIPNGFDTDHFCPEQDADLALRSRFSLPADSEIVGCIARFDPVKDHLTFVRAAGLLAVKRPNVRFVLSGRDMTWDNATLVGWLRTHGIAGRTLLLGHQDDVRPLARGATVITLSSVVESFPNAIGEAMACGTPCVVTDVGDSAHLVGDTGLVVPPSDAEGLANAWHQLLVEGRDRRLSVGMAARLRIISLFSLSTVARRYSSLYHELADAPSRTFGG